jgi:hypothetical protein
MEMLLFVGLLVFALKEGADNYELAFVSGSHAFDLDD